ncbi:MAG: hypothetical protein K8T26_05930 [Lentisphaerae bacterium]|nr:hypothetical protein [Lentisphaerota bacterium]
MLSLLSSQLGYQTAATKRGYVRDLNRHVIPDETEFEIRDANDGSIAHRSKTSYWGEKWKSHWWILDFSALTTPGTYRLEIAGCKSNPFPIGPTPLVDCDMVDIALNQLDARHNHGEAATYLNGQLRFPGRWMTPDGTHPQGIYRDCMSNFAEIESVGMTTTGLIELDRHQRHKFSERDQERIRDYIVLGADCIVASQRKTDDPKTNGRFAHSILVNTKHDGCAWAGNVYNWHDMAYAIVVLCKAYEAVRSFDVAKAQTYLDSAILAYTCAATRPYHLTEEYELPRRDDAYDPIKDYDKACWTPMLEDFRTDPGKFAFGVNNYQEYARMFYDKPADWQEPTTLKTREMLPFLHGCTLLYRLTGERKYLDTALEFAASIAGRQFTDWRHPIEGVYGTFYEFEGDHQAFSVESGQAGGQFMGHIDALNVNGFIELLRLVPEHPDAAKWLNVITLYTDHYVRTSADLNPLRIHPLSVYRDPQHGGVKFFMNLVHGATGHYGQMAGNLLELADFLNDGSLVSLAEANLHVYTGLNPGVPSPGNDSWRAATLINKVGPSYYNTGGESIKGGVINGFRANRNWFLTPIAQLPDAPGLAGGDEDWVAHSHPYVGAAARMEAPFALRVETRNDGEPVPATVCVRVPESHAYATDAQGGATITDLPCNRTGSISVQYGARTITRDLATIPGGTLRWSVDFAHYAGLSLEVPERLQQKAEATGRVTIRNLGSASMRGRIQLSASGVSLATTAMNIELAPGNDETIPIIFRGGDRVMPYLVYAIVKTDQGVLAVAAGSGRIDTNSAQGGLESP